MSTSGKRDFILLILENRNDYFTIERKGRSYPLDKPYRSLMLKGLSCWEQKMQPVGVTDYLGISSALSHHIDKIKPGYRCVLVDESQDFGTTELALIRKLVKKAMNDIFLSGDAAQKISYKYQSLPKAGIDIHKSRSSSILKNYRNSREILQFAHSVL
jgi:superfamily I DNA and RNA helicase